MAKLSCTSERNVINACISYYFVHRKCRASVDNGFLEMKIFMLPSTICTIYIHVVCTIHIVQCVNIIYILCQILWYPGKISIGWGCNPGLCLCNPSLCLFRLKKGEGVEETWNGKKMTPSSFKQYSIKESVATPVPPSRPATAPSILP